MAKQLGRYRCTDMLGLHPVRVRDQEEEPEGELLCRLLEGKNGDWMGHDGRGRPLRVKRNRDGSLEIRHLSEAGGDDAAVFGAEYPGGGDPGRAAGSTGDAALRAWQGNGEWHHHGRALAAYQRRLNEHYRG